MYTAFSKQAAGKLFGMGTDIVPVDRFEKLAEDAESIMLQRLFTEKEGAQLRGIPSAKQRYQKFAASFAVKEALFKALGTGLGPGMSWKDVEVDHLFGSCDVTTFGRTQALCEELNICDCRASSSATQSLATAVVLLFQSP